VAGAFVSFCARSHRKEWLRPGQAVSGLSTQGRGAGGGGGRITKRKISIATFRVWKWYLCRKFTRGKLGRLSRR